MHDAHVHLAFMENGEEVAADARREGIMLFAPTVTPEEFASARKRFSPFDNVLIGWGVHPWWVDGNVDPTRLLIPNDVRFIGEVGLDFGKRHLGNREAQVETFRNIMRACADGGNVISIHSVHAAQETLDILEETGALERNTCIFHWFTGPSDQLKRAIEAGCFFSAGPRMVATGKGREYMKVIPADRLMLETDAPPEQGARCTIEDLKRKLTVAAEAIAAIKGPAALETVEATFCKVFA